MFTGLIYSFGEIIDRQLVSSGIQFKIKTDWVDWKIGESLSVQGVCLTVTHFDSQVVSVDVSSETLSCTTAADWQKHQIVHLERALSAGDRLGGHFVLGHVDGVLTVSSKGDQDEFTAIHFSGVLPEHQSWLYPKGSVAINGVSLTIQSLDPTGFGTLLIPHTLEKTTFRALEVGDKVNVEYDALAKMVAYQVKGWMSREKTGE